MVSDFDRLVPDTELKNEFAVSPMTLWRWDRCPAMAVLGWPLPIRIRGRKFRSRAQIEKFESQGPRIHARC